MSVKYKREHLNKKHQISEDVYDELIAKKQRGEDITEELPERATRRCHICDRECLDIRKHLERSHQITEDLYDEMVANGDIREDNIAEGSLSSSPTGAGGMAVHAAPAVRTRKAKTDAALLISNGAGVGGGGGGGHTSSTDLHCPLGCNESFKKDFQVHLHLKLRHRNEPQEVMKRAFELVEEEVELTKRSASIYQCALCEKQFNDNGAFYSHISTKHSMKWNEYKERFGRCEVESAPFECKICSRVVKYDRNTVHTHLKNVHGINWEIYVERLRKLRKGEVPSQLPQMESVECKVCNVTVKHLRDHLRNAHKITELEYGTLFEEEQEECREDGGLDGGGQVAGFGAGISVSRVPKQFTQPVPEQMPMVDASYSDPPPPPKPPKSDIQDKTNKHCSSCTISFESRRSFIEHCTTVHNMKFKTKSGLTISAAGPNGKAVLVPQEHLEAQMRGMPSKRPLPPLISTSSTPPPPQKRPKNVFVNEGSLQVECSPHLGPQYTSSGVSKWNQCRYECCFCRWTTMSRSSMSSHVQNAHHISITDYKKANYPDIEVETNWFQCRLCPTRTKFVKDCVAPHLKMSHNLEIEQYEKDYMQASDWPSNAFLRQPHEAPLTRQQQEQGVKSTPKSSRELAVLAVKEDKWNKCKFQCAICEWVSIDSRQMRSHIAAQHCIAYDKYVLQYGSSEVVSKKFRCELCNSVFKHCRQNVSSCSALFSIHILV